MWYMRRELHLHRPLFLFILIVIVLLRLLLFFFFFFFFPPPPFSYDYFYYCCYYYFLQPCGHQLCINLFIYLSLSITDSFSCSFSPFREYLYRKHLIGLAHAALCSLTVKAHFSLVSICSNSFPPYFCLSFSMSRLAPLSFLSFLLFGSDYCNRFRF